MAGEEKIEVRMQGIWRLACELGVELEKLDDLFNSRSAEFAALQSAQSALRDWRGCYLGELMNMAGIPAEKRAVLIKKEQIVERPGRSGI